MPLLTQALYNNDKNKNCLVDHVGKKLKTVLQNFVIELPVKIVGRVLRNSNYIVFS